jgi:hypothetical protein
MQEESLKHADLPQDIREDIEELEELKSEYKEYPSEAGKNELIKESIAIADTIQDWLERDLPEDENVNVDKIESKTEEFVPTWKFW